MDNFPLKNGTYEIIGACMKVQRTPGDGFSEVIYKDAMEREFITNNFFIGEKMNYQYCIKTKNFNIDTLLILFVMIRLLLK